MASLAATLAVILAYNHIRFDSPFDFGIRYQLAGIHSMKITFFSLPRLAGNAYLFLLYPPHLSATFPFLSLSLPWLEPSEKYLFFEPIAGLVWISPLLLTVLLAPWLVYKEQGERRRMLAWFLGVLLITALALLCLDATLVATMRYAADFASLLFIVEAMVIAGLWQILKSSTWRPVCTIVLVMFGLAGMGANAALGLSDYFGGFRAAAPDQYAALAKVFHPVSSMLQALGVKP